MLCGETICPLPLKLDDQDGSFMNIFAELRKLREKNARLKDLLTRHGIVWEDSRPLGQTAPSQKKSSLFRQKFARMWNKCLRGEQSMGYE